MPKRKKKSDARKTKLIMWTNSSCQLPSVCLRNRRTVITNTSTQAFLLMTNLRPCCWVCLRKTQSNCYATNQVDREAWILFITFDNYYYFYDRSTRWLWPGHAFYRNSNFIFPFDRLCVAEPNHSGFVYGVRDDLTYSERNKNEDVFAIRPCERRTIHERVGTREIYTYRAAHGL